MNDITLHVLIPCHEILIFSQLIIMRTGRRIVLQYTVRRNGIIILCETGHSEYMRRDWYSYIIVPYAVIYIVTRNIFLVNNVIRSQILTNFLFIILVDNYFLLKWCCGGF